MVDRHCRHHAVLLAALGAAFGPFLRTKRLPWGANINGMFLVKDKFVVNCRSPVGNGPQVGNGGHSRHVSRVNGQASAGAIKEIGVASHGPDDP